MTPFIDLESLKRLIAEMDEKYQRLAALQRSHSERADECRNHCYTLNAKISHLKTILEAHEAGEQADQVLSAPCPESAVEEDELVGELGPIPPDPMADGAFGYPH